LDALTFMASLIFWLLRNRASYDAVHVHLAGSPAVAAALAARLAGKPVLVKLGGGKGIGELAVSSRTIFGRLKLRALACLKPSLVAVARELAEEAAAHLGPLPVELIPNGVDLARFKPENRVAARRALGLPEEGPLFLYAGRLSVEKSLPAFVSVWGKTVQALSSPAALVIVGEGIEEPAIRAAVSRAGVERQVHFRPPDERIEAYYQAADVFVLPSVSEGLSNALLEAMASGTAILASRVGGTAEAVDDSVQGLLFPAGDEISLARAIERLLKDEALLRRLGAAARLRAQERYTLDGVCARYEALYRALL
jgi:glycosyltransferase involved in cell wall biosynthesis